MKAPLVGILLLISITFSCDKDSKKPAATSNMANSAQCGGRLIKSINWKNKSLNYSVIREFTYNMKRIDQIDLLLINHDNGDSISQTVNYYWSLSFDSLSVSEARAGKAIGVNLEGNDSAMYNYNGSNLESIAYIDTGIYSNEIEISQNNFFYTGMGELTKMTRFNYGGFGSLEVAEYHYKTDANGNIIELEYNVNGYHKTTYQYDNHPNPFRCMPLWANSTTYPITFFNKNNIVSWVNTRDSIISDTNYNKYDYDSQGYPVKILHGVDGSIDETELTYY